MPTSPTTYKWFWHPEKSWVDILFCVLTWFVFPLQKLAKLSAKNEKATIEGLEPLRKILKDGNPGRVKSLLQSALHDKSSSFLEYRCKIPRRALLKEWGLYTENFATPEQSFISVVMRFPSTTYKKEIEFDSKQRNEYGCVVVEDLDFTAFDRDVPLVIYFHSGGMAIGDEHDSEGFRPFYSGSKTGLVFASVDYSLSPEYPFPAAVEEAMVVSLYFLRVFRSGKVHLCGISAGANLAAVATMELHRQQHHVSSALIAVPMLNPAADSTSYYQNKESMFPDVGWLRWCWRAYLGLGNKRVMEDDPIAQGSNRTLWRESRWIKDEKLARLVNPCIDVPRGMISKWIVVTNSGDPLRDDGIELVTQLQSSGADVEYMAHRGSHWFGSVFCRKSMEEVVTSWSNVLFSK